MQIRRQFIVSVLAGLLLAACIENATDGRILTWHREGGLAGFCDDVSVYTNGQVRATSCRGGQPRDLGASRLTDDQLRQVLAWRDKLKGFEINQADPATADKMTVRLVFAGAGAVAATEADRQAIQDFAVKLFADSSK